MYQGTLTLLLFSVTFYAFTLTIVGGSSISYKIESKWKLLIYLSLSFMSKIFENMKTRIYISISIVKHLCHSWAELGVKD